MTSILAALVRLNVAPQKIGFWEIQLEREETMTAFAEAFHTEVKRRQTHTASQKTVVQQDLLKVETGIKRYLLLTFQTPLYECYIITHYRPLCERVL